MAPEALRICANILVHKVMFTTIFMRTWWYELDTSHSCQPCKDTFVPSLVNKKHISSGSSHEWLWSVVNPTHIICMYLKKFVELATTMPRGVHLNKSRLDRKSNIHTFGIIMPSHRLGTPLLLHLRSHVSVYILGMLVELINDLAIVVEACYVKGMLYVNGRCSVYEPITSSASYNWME